MTYSEYLELVRAAAKCSSLEEVIARAGEQGESLDDCEIIFAASRGDLKKLVGRQSARAFGIKYRIPDRTVQLWVKGERSAPEYLILLLGYAVMSEKSKEKRAACHVDGARNS